MIIIIVLFTCIPSGHFQNGRWWYANNVIGYVMVSELLYIFLPVVYASFLLQCLIILQMKELKTNETVWRPWLALQQLI